MNDQLVKYAATLATLYDGPQKLGREGLQKICPHLTHQQVSELIDKSTQFHVATPPLKVKGGFLVIYYSNGRLELSHARRTARSYSYIGDHRITPSDAYYQQEAMAYAEKYWPEQLVTDTWQSYVVFHLDDPTQLDKKGHPKRAVTVCGTTSIPWNQIEQDSSAPRSQVIDKHLVHITLDKAKALELKGDRGPYIFFNCANCGYGLGISQCRNCEAQFP